MKNDLIRILLSTFTCIIAFISPVESQVNTDRVLAIGKSALYFEDYVLSIQYFNQVIKAKSYLADPYLYRAIAKFNLEDYNGAENDITLCLERNPFLVYAYQCRGAARQNLQDYQGAIQDYNKGLEFKPEDRQMLINKSIAYIQSKQYPEAESSLNLLIQYHPKFTQAYLTRGSLFMEEKDTLNALSDFNAAAGMDKYYAPVYGQRGLLYYQVDSLDKALADFNEAIRLEPRQIAYYINRGLVRYGLNDLRGTMSDYDIVLDLESENLIARFNRGLLRAQLGDNNRAIEDFDVVIDHEPDNYMAIYNRAMLREEIGDNRGAIEDINKVVDEYPNFFIAYYYRADIKRKMRDNIGADKDYWYAYDLEQKLLKEKEKGKVVTGKEILPAGTEVSDDESGKTRQESDNDIEKFNRLVTYDKEEEQASKYKDEIRGRVQDKQVKIDLEPQFVITYYEKVEGIQHVPQFDKTVSDFNKEKKFPLQLNITNKEAALTDDQAAMHFQSINDFSLQISRNPSDADVYFGRALDFMLLQDLSEALADYDRVIDLNSNYLMAYFNRAVVKFKQMEIDDYDETRNGRGSDNELELSLNIQIGNKKIRSGGSYMNSLTENSDSRKENQLGIEYESIIQDYTKCIQINPGFVYAYFNRGNLQCRKKDYRAAILDYNEAIQREPDFAEAYFNRGLTRLYLGDSERGIADLSKAGELGLVNAYGIIKRMTVD